MKRITVDEFLLSFNNSVNLEKNNLSKDGNYYIANERLSSSEIAKLKESGLVHIGQKIHNHIAENYFYSAPDVKAENVEAENG